MDDCHLKMVDRIDGGLVVFTDGSRILFPGEGLYFGPDERKADVTEVTGILKWDLRGFRTWIREPDGSFTESSAPSPDAASTTK